jgi:hypothetical protein
MGLGTKLKEALHGDNHRHYSATDTSKTPGSFPSDEVPRSYNQDVAYDSPLNSDSETRTEKVTGKSSPKHTHGSTTSRRERNTADFLEDGKVDGLNRTGTAKTTGKRLSKGTKDPYWGDTDATGSNAFGATTGTHDRNAHDLNAQEINGRYKATTARDGFTPDGHTPHTNRGDKFAHSGQNGSALSDHHEATEDDDIVESSIGTTTLTHRPHNETSQPRNAKTEDYDAPTNSAGRGKTSLATAGAGAAAGYGASRLADRHYEEELRAEDTTGAGRWGDRRNHDDAHDVAGSRTTGVGTSMLDAYGRGSNNNKTTATRVEPSTIGTHEKNSPARETGYTRAENASAGTSEYGHDSGLGMDQGHFGPGHSGAKVMHRCYNCGADNDITKHFRKDAVYRMS